MVKEVSHVLWVGAVTASVLKHTKSFPNAAKKKKKIKSKCKNSNVGITAVFNPPVVLECTEIFLTFIILNVALRTSNSLCCREGFVGLALCD